MILRVPMRSRILGAVVIVSTIALGIAAVSNAAPMPPGPSTVSQAAYPTTVKAGEYSVVNIILKFAPGTGVPKHYHGGYVLVTVLSGEITLFEKGTTKVVTTGQSWTEAPRAVHSVLNRGKTDCTVAVSILISSPRNSATEQPFR